MSKPIGMSGLAFSAAAAIAASYTPSAARVGFFDDFLGDSLDARWNVVEGTDAVTSDATIVANGVGGILRLATGDTGTGLAADMIQLNTALQFQADNGDLEVSVRLALSQITDTYLFFGFTDTVSLEGPVISSGVANGVTTNASNAVGLMFDTRMGTDTLWVVGVDTDVDGVPVNSAIAPVAGTMIDLTVKVGADGAVAAYINGNGVYAGIAPTMAANVAVTPVLCLSKTATATAMTADVDYVAIGMKR